MEMISGILGCVNGVTMVRDWEASLKANTQAFINSGTRGGTGRRRGNTDWSGSYNCDGHLPALWPGQTFTFSGATQGTKGITGPAIVDEVTIKWDIEAGKIIENSTKFSGNGVYTRGAVTIVPETAFPDPLTSIGCKAMLDATEILQVRTMSLTVKCDNKTGVHSGTAGATARRKGNIDANVSIACYFDDPSLVPGPNEVGQIKLFINSTLFYDLKNMIFGELSGIKVDVNTAAIVGGTINAAMNAFIEGGSTAGYIKTPEGATIWPA